MMENQEYKKLDQIGKLTLIEFIPKGRGGSWKAKCECGKNIKLSQSRLKNGTKSCGCIKKKWHKTVRNKKFGRLKVLKQTSEVYRDGTKCWICKCDCGNKTLVKRSDLAIRKTCGKCHVKSNNINLSNTENQHWVILDAVESKSKDRIYKCVCKYCKNECEKPYYVLNYIQIEGCGCIRKQKIQQSKNRYDLEEIKYNRTYCSYKKSAIRRGLEFNLTKKDLIDFVNGNCFYCGIPPFSLRKVSSKDKCLFNGIDRIDNTKGYLKENCVSCCKTCNIMKNVMNIADFKIKIKKIHQHLKLENE